MKAVILARGLGKRMRAASHQATLDETQQNAADTGVKAMIPVGRPFLDYSLSALADAGIQDVCLIIGPEHNAVIDYYTGPGTPNRVQVTFAMQPEPLGTADAVLVAEEYVSGEDFLILNSDNYYPASALSALCAATPPAIAAFAGDALVKLGNVTSDRLQRFGALEFDSDGSLSRITGNPVRARKDGGGTIYCSLNCWSFTPLIFDACRKVTKSARGEYELTQAVQLAIDTMSYEIRVVKLHEGVLDLSTRDDIAAVTDRLSNLSCDP